MEPKYMNAFGNLKLWRDLDPAEEQEFRDWARDNYVVGQEIKTYWHPVVQDECVRMTREQLGGAS